MRLTTLGKFCIFLLLLTLWNAVNGGLNLLYLIYSGIVGAFVIAAIFTRLAARAIEVEVAHPEQIFAGDEVPLAIRLKNRSPFPVLGLSIVTRKGRVAVGDIRGRSTKTVYLPYEFPRRGLTDITDAVLEVRFPFGLFARKKPIAAHGITVYPQLMRDFEARRARDLMQEEVARPRRGVGDEFWGIREFNEGDDARQISWKLTAKLGRPIIKEYAQMVGDRVVVKVSGTPPGEETERRISEAASVARFFIDEGAEVRLVTDEGDTGFGRGLLHLGVIMNHLATLGSGKDARGTGEARFTRDEFPELGRRGTLHAITYIMAAVVAASLWLVEGLDPVTKVGIWIALAVGIAFDRTGRYPVPAWILNLLSVLVLVFVFAIDIPSGGLLPGLTHLLAYVMANRLISPKGKRDTGIIALVCFLMFLLIAWQTVKPSFLVAYAAFFTVAAFWAAQIQRASTKPGLGRAAMVVVSVVLMLATASAAFALTPRVANPRFAKLMRRLGLADMVLSELSIVKLADSVPLGIFDDIRTNSRRVMQVSIAGFTEGKGRSLLIRGGALDRFDGEGWSRSDPEFLYSFYGQTIESAKGKALYERGAAGGFYTTGNYDPDSKGMTQEFYVYPMRSSLIFSVGDPTAVAGSVVLPAFDISGTAYTSTDFEGGGRYIVISQSIPVRLFDSIDNYDAYVSELFLQLPEEYERVGKLAREIAGGETSEMGKALAIESYLREKFLYSYLGAHGMQSMEDFLFETKAANCEYFATSMAIMLRTLGIPSRLIVGYLAHDWQQVEGFFDVRNSDGHAWVEALIPDMGWVAFDPTPENVGYEPVAFPLGRTIYGYVLHMQLSWYRYVVGYDFYVQQDVLAGLIAKWRRILIGLVIVAGSALLIAAVYIAVRSRIGRRGDRADALPATAAYEKALSLLAKKGYRRTPGQTPGQFAFEVTKSNPHLAILEELTLAYYSWRYGDADGTRTRGLLKKLKGALARHTESSISLRKPT